MPKKRFFAFIDEAGAKGYIKDLPSNRDTEVAIMAALLVDQNDHPAIEAAFRPGYQQFVNAAGSGTLHFTEAFLDPNGAWATTARQVRQDFFALLLQYKIPIIYSVIRVDAKRAEHQERTDLIQQLTQERRSAIEVKPPIDDSTLETDTFQDLLVKVGTFAEDEDAEIDVRLDETSSGVLRSFRRAGEDLKDLGQMVITPTGYDREAGKPVKGATGKFTLSSSFPVEVTTIKTITVASKTDPLVLAIDGIVNSLNHHLGKLPPDADLETRVSLKGWVLEPLVQLAP